MSEPQIKPTHKTGTKAPMAKMPEVVICPEYDDLDKKSWDSHLPTSNTPKYKSKDVVYC